jgi:hypothetical protein
MGKYQTRGNDFDVYKTDLYLNISLSDPADFGTYYCISKNDKGLTKAAIELFGINMFHHEEARPRMPLSSDDYCTPVQTKNVNK